MTSPSETPLDLDALEVPYIAIRDDGSTTLTYATKEGARATIPLPPQISQVLRVAEQSLSEAYATIDRLESRPRTVGDLTARDLGRRVRIEFTEFTLDAMEYAGSLTGGPCLVMRSGERGWPNFDTPVEFLDDEPASGHQQPGERLPSPDQAAQVLGDPETAEGAL